MSVHIPCLCAWIRVPHLHITLINKGCGGLATGVILNRRHRLLENKFDDEIVGSLLAVILTAVADVPRLICLSHDALYESHRHCCYLACGQVLMTQILSLNLSLLAI